MWIEVGNRLCKVVRSEEHEVDWLREYLSFPDANARFRRGKSDGRVRMYNLFDDSFPTGFITMVRKAALDAKITIELIDKRTRPAVDPDADLAWLRDYQREGVDRALAKGRGILWLSTGAGKTEIAVGLARAVVGHALFLVHRTSLGKQAADRFLLRNGEHGVDLGEPGVIGEGEWYEGERFTAATFQTLAKALAKNDPRALRLLGRSELLVVDECHVLPAESFFDVTAACNAYYRIGLSGTPLARGDQKSIMAIAALGPVIHRVKADVLVDAGVLAKARIRLVTCSQPKPRALTFAGVYHEKVVSSTVRNDVIARIAVRAAKPNLLFIKEIKHGRELAKRLGRAGLNVEFVHGNHSTDYRKSVVRRLVRGALDVVICSVIFQEGIDIPELRSVINAGGSKSIIATLQKLGRGMRVERDPSGNVRPGGDEFEMWDIFDIAPRASGEEPGWLEKHARARKNAYIAEGHETVVEPEIPGVAAAS